MKNLGWYKKMKKRDTILEQANKIIRKEYNSNFQFNTMGRTERTWFFTICKILDQRLVKIKKEFRKELDEKIIF